MIVAVIAVGMMKMARDQIIDMIAVRNLLVPAVRVVAVSGFVASTIMLRRARSGVLSGDPDPVLLKILPFGMMQMSVVQVIDMAIVFDSGMTAIRAVVVGVAFVDGHFSLL